MSRSEALKASQKRHAEKIRRVELSFSASEMPLYDKLKEKAASEDKSVNAVVKELIKNS